MLALDCDNTLWRGVAAEDGPLGVVVDAPRRALQNFLLARRAEGWLLTLCSKNEEEDVWAVFDHHPGMVLRRAHLAGARIGWRPKPEGLRALAAELGLGLDALVLLDDNPLECAEVEAHLPAVLALHLPADHPDPAGWLAGVWAFDRARTTDDDRHRAARYVDEAGRMEARRAAPSFAAFLAGLELEVTFTSLDTVAPRAAQLTERTNQFHCAPRRRSEAELLALAGLPGAEVWTAAVRDRFGDYGTVGLVVATAIDGALRAETFLLSCRALGRGVEHRLLAELGRRARARGLARVEVPFVATPRNRPAGDFLRRSGAVAAPHGAGLLFTLPAVAAAAARFEPAEEGPHEPPATERAAAGPAGHHAAARARAVRRAAGDLADPAQVLAEAAARRAAAAPAPRADYVAPANPLEQELALLWTEVLGVARVGTADDFFDLGGDSLLGVQLISRVRAAFGVEITLRELLAGRLTVAEMARQLEEAQIRQAEAGDLREILAELDGLSEDEVRALLESEGR
jgi:FkbH-like protein